MHSQAATLAVDGERPGRVMAEPQIRRVRPVATEVAERRKPAWPLHSEGVKRTLSVSQESKKEIPDKCSVGLYLVKRLPRSNRSGKRNAWTSGDG
jgi:hypothetical protein